MADLLGRRSVRSAAPLSQASTENTTKPSLYTIGKSMEDT